MNRTLKYKLIFVVVSALTLAGVVLSIVLLDLGVAGMLAAAIVFLVPGRAGAYFLRDLFLSRRYVDAGQYEDAIAASERFVRLLDLQPWRQHFIYCSYCIYTWNTRAMALNNLGAARMELGLIDDAELPLGEALALDAAYPIPYYNLSVIEAVREDHARSDQLLSKARQLGFGPSAVDKVIMRVAAAYARVQSVPS
ncbi:MAG: hypothetical protein ACR2PM_11065 [Hyphomicrobiales bacterium]